MANTSKLVTEAVFNHAIHDIKGAIAGNTKELTGIKEKIAGHTEELTEIKEKIAGNTNEITGLKIEIAGNTKEIIGIKGVLARNTDEITGIKGEITGINQRMNSMEKRLDEKINNVAVGLVKVEGRLERVENTMATQDAVRSVAAQVDNLIGMWKEQYQKGFFNQNRLNVLDDHVANHEKRLVALETRKIGSI